MKLILVVSMLLACATAAAQEVIWERLFDASRGVRWGIDVVQSHDGGFLAVGAGGPQDRRIADIHLVHTTSAGDLLWEKTIPDHDSTVVTALFRAEDSAYYIVGSTRDGATPVDTSWHPWIAKLDADGDILWEKRQSGGRVNGAIRTGDGSFILTGEQSDARVMLMKIDRDGELAWAKAYEYGVGATGASVRQTANGDLIIVGSTVNEGNPDPNLLLLRVSGAGDSLWAAAYMRRFVAADEGYCVEELEGGDFFVVGTEKWNGTDDRFSYLLTLRVGPQGDMGWIQSFSLFARGEDSLGINQPYMSRKLDDGSIVICGASGPDHTMPFLAHFGTDGELRWRKMLSPLIFSVSAASSFRPLPDGGFIVTGTKMGQMLLMRVGTSASDVEPDRSLPSKLDLSWIVSPEVDR